MGKTLIFLFWIIVSSVNGQTIPSDYKSTIKSIIKNRDAYCEFYAMGDSVTKDSIVGSARNYLIYELTQHVFPAWYGTPWDFYGTTRTPGQGAIACGYFVTNVLSDIGFIIPRIRWAQDPSEVFIKKLVEKENIKRFHNRSVGVVESYLKEKGEGIYLVGLDRHVGFISVNGDKIRFVHSSYYQPEIGVMSEQLNSKNPLKYSKYRVIGKLFSDEMVVNWITGYEYGK
ncbi:hypothetical protein ACE1ET_05455 [Saccharicrinis sp. FJH62]|uniref:hypothetical protein n=1 Tax=Saccharicrinis sp. FJH62 TaxID=3344657 RepID=UPI0035D48DE3